MLSRWQDWSPVRSRKIVDFRFLSIPSKPRLSKARVRAPPFIMIMVLCREAPRRCCPRKLPPHRRARRESATPGRASELIAIYLPKYRLSDWEANLLESGLVLWSPGIQCRNHHPSCWWDRDLPGQNDLPCWYFLSVNLPIGAIIGTNG